MNRPLLLVRRTGNAGFTLLESSVGLSVVGTLAGQTLLVLLKLHQ